MSVFVKNEGKFEDKPDIPFEGGTKEQELEDLLFLNPELFPVIHIADSTRWIPLARQVGISNHGTLDILATDSTGNLYIVECKIKGNGDMKTIRGQITDYTSGLWAERNSWEYFEGLVKNTSIENKSVKEMLIEKGVADIPDVLDDIKRNFEDGKYFLVYAVDRITPGLRDAITWHNQELDTNDKYPCFAMSIKRYVDENNSEFVVTQNFPYDLNELKKKKEKSGNRRVNEKEDWMRVFDEADLTDEQRINIQEFVTEIEDMITRDGGKIAYGTGTRMPRMLPKFNYTGLRSAIGLKANGNLVFQFKLLGGEYPDEVDQFREKVLEIDDLKNVLESANVKSEPSIPIKKWIDHRKEILSILDDIFVKRIN